MRQTNKKPAGESTTQGPVTRVNRAFLFFGFEIYPQKYPQPAIATPKAGVPRDGFWFRLDAGESRM